ncbi:FAD-binding oxidoreductase [Virgibacillus sp. MSP4-1]|uniref:FAD-binding oxidoreductase n=1 Tax=Virgibacillus sp. MSP4-1 TaxID=2700081 RepID=UPI00039D82AF|nr:FAD-binding oxidoreductase [Virgibacillus sp. MSP4-1]QHS21457.1 FAD-binding oxidoreductase [Virgibacillus sp. MSP4-1]
MQLQTIIPDHERLFLDKDVPEAYKTDHSWKDVAAVKAVALPESEQEIRDLVTYANQEDLSIIARGAGTGVAGSQVPTKGGELIIDVHRMNRILEMDEETMTLTVEPGVQLQEIQDFVERKGYFYPPDPGSKNSTIGGNIATNAGGMRAVKYGTTRDYVRELDVVLPDGQKATLGSLNIKDSSGYDLKDLFIGSEGTLGITTRIKLKVLPMPKYKQSVILTFDSLKAATDGVLSILKNGVEPAALELFERGTIEYSEKFTEKKLQSQKGDAYILMTLDSNEQEDLSRRISFTENLLKEQAVEILPLTTPEEEEKAWFLRDHILVALMQFTEFEMLDEVVPINRFAEMISYTKELQEKHGINVINFGHAGDGNIHTVLMKEGMDEAAWQTKRKAYLDDLYNKVHELGGLPSAEHGIGVIKKGYLEKMSQPVEIQLMRKIKNAIDPDNRLNPGKIF